MQQNSQNGADLVALITRLEDQVKALNRKIDKLMARVFEHEPQAAEQATEAWGPYDGPVKAEPDIDYGPARNEPVKDEPEENGAKDRQRREKVEHKAVCADCQKECVLPFKPNADRPVYCQECFTARKKARREQGRSKKPQEAAATDVLATDGVTQEAVLQDATPVETAPQVPFEIPVEQQTAGPVLEATVETAEGAVTETAAENSVASEAPAEERSPAPAKRHSSRRPARRRSSGTKSRNRRGGSEH